jgi:NADH-quinone oxidoreductase subunit L
MVFFGQPRTQPAAHARENPPLITLPLIVLAGLSVLGGALNLPGVHTFGGWLEHTIQIVQESHGEGHVAGGFNLIVAVVSSLLALLALFLSWVLYGRKAPESVRASETSQPDDPLRNLLGPVFIGMHNKWWVDELYWAIIVRPYQALARFLADVVDWRFWHDWFHDTLLVGGFNLFTRLLAVRIDLGIIDAIANGLGKAMQDFAGNLRRIQTGYVRNYALAVFAGAVVILGYIILR